MDRIKSRVLAIQRGFLTMPSSRNDSEPPPHRIGRAGPAKRMAGIERLLGSDRQRAERFMRFARETAMDLEHLWCAVDADGKVLSTVLASINPGRTAMLFVSPPRKDDEIPTAVDVIEAASAALSEAGLCLVQALVTPDEVRERKAFEAGGLNEIAILTYMQATLGRKHRKAPEVPEGCSFRSYQPGDRHLVEKLLAQTYVNTLDCPQLVGLRQMDDILDGHMNSGIFKPEWWSILFMGDTPVGACLTNSARDGKSAELVYLGITPEMRGQGLGRALLAHALSIIAESTTKTVALAVDESNAPAVEMYRSAGFSGTIRRHAFVRKVDQNTATN